MLGDWLPLIWQDLLYFIDEVNQVTSILAENYFFSYYAERATHSLKYDVNNIETDAFIDHDRNKQKCQKVNEHGTYFERLQTTAVHVTDDSVPAKHLQMAAHFGGGNITSLTLLTFNKTPYHITWHQWSISELHLKNGTYATFNYSGKIVPELNGAKLTNCRITDL